MKTKLKSLVAVTVFMLSVTGAYAQEKITFTTSKKKGEKIQLAIGSPQGSEGKDIYIDLNNNGKKDKGEEVKLHDLSDYTLSSQTFSIYGKVSMLECAKGGITNLDVSGSKGLTQLNCSENQLSALDVSKNTNLEFLNCKANNLSVLNLSTNVKLTDIYCRGNKLKALDLSKNTSLYTVDCSANNLTSLNIANGKNKEIAGDAEFITFNATKNPNLKCIKIDAGFTPTEKIGWKKDATAKYDTNCAGAGVVDNVFNASVMLYPNPVNSTLNIKTDNTEIKETSVYNLLGKKLLKTNKPNLDVANLSKGIYLVKIKGADNKLAVKKFVKN